MTQDPVQVLLLTAAIDTTPAMVGNLRHKSDLRRADYVAGLRHYIETLPPSVGPILFCENTGADLTEFEAMKPIAAQKGHELHILGFKGQTTPDKGKGVCEFEILDTAHRWLADHFPTDTVVWKVTGRLLIKNIAQMVASRPTGAGIYVDMRSVPLIGESLGGNDWTEMRLMSYTIESYGKYLDGHGPELGYVTEKGLFKLLNPKRATDPTIVPRFKVQPRFKGICGGSNKDYESFEYQVKDGVRTVARTLAPGLWL